MNFVIPLLLFFQFILIVNSIDNTLMVSVVDDTGGGGHLELHLSWSKEHNFVKATIVVDKCYYQFSQLSCHTVHTVQSQGEDVKVVTVNRTTGTSQYRLTLKGVDDCRHSTVMISYLGVPPANDISQYMLVGPVHPRNMSVAWFDPELPEGGAGATSYTITWRKVDGQVNHPGHHVKLVSNTYVITGLIPGSRFEVCVRRAGPRRSAFCSSVYTAEDVPGPPVVQESWCVSQAHGTHWRCHVSWLPPTVKHGRIIGYHVLWKDVDDYTLHQDHNVFCSTNSDVCSTEHTTSFRPTQGCVAAVTAVGVGWEHCDTVHDVRSRLFSLLERKTLYAVTLTLVFYTFGPRVLGVLARCCVRCLASQFIDKKDHIV